MEINLTNENGILTLQVDGNIDTLTSSELENTLRANWDNATQIVIDFEKVPYISSAGLRVIIATYKKMQAQGSFMIKNLNKDVLEVFQMTGFDKFLNIQ